MIKKINGICEVVLGRYPEIMNLYEKIERIDEETVGVRSALDIKDKLEERWRLIDLLIEDAKAKGCFNLFESVFIKASDKEMGWISTWPVKFFVPRNEKNIITETYVLKRWIEKSGGLFVPHNSYGGFYRDDKSANTFTILLFPESISTIVEIDSIGGSNGSTKITIARLKMDGSLLCYKTGKNKSEIAMTLRDVIPRIEIE